MHTLIKYVQEDDKAQEVAAVSICVHIDEAIKHLRAALLLCPNSHSDYSQCIESSMKVGLRNSC